MLIHVHLFLLISYLNKIKSPRIYLSHNYMHVNIHSVYIKGLKSRGLCLHQSTVYQLIYLNARNMYINKSIQLKSISNILNIMKILNYIIIYKQQ